MENSAGDIEITELYIFKLHNFCWNTLWITTPFHVKDDGQNTDPQSTDHDGPSKWTALKREPSKILFYLSSIEISVFYIF